ncbi:heme biosynthesis protein HemY [Legionella micdadei]|uniref:HemY protein n=1 Tax=Legionella micdadei TaxID=451 RepID=A0A098GJE2_LEGMI|nr:heme biosynthesis protein HemY [Legionella micdadei]ARG96545.1 protoporphyrinogen oxidase [Legionella micdadei]ARG99293.1 protoporphyrinogen oxidase [Legionella micdadei]KTD27385.1 protoporphyrinogen oxidase [Legionella micdadei]NSL18826.1 heme biosynthesis protein HemY [Legionella micdadei]CEG62095.1 Protoporphyrinogen IX and coproporphyrinogen III oxidase HemY [Legionella micdadei]
MIRLLIFFIVLLISVYLGIQLSHDPGYVLVSINHWSIETTLWFAVIALIIFFLLFHCIFLLLRKLSRSPTSFRDWQNKRRILKAQAKTQQGLIEFSEGYWSQAKNHLIKALPDTDSPLLNYLTAARAAQEMGDSKLRDNYLREAQQSMPNAKIAVELTQAQLQLANQQWEQALATLRHLQDLAPRHPYVLKLLMRLYIEVKDWSQLIELLPELKKHQVVTGAAFERLQHQTYLQAISDLTKYSQREALTKLIEHLPKNLSQDPELMAEYCRFLLTCNENQKAESILRQCLRRQFSENLINLYGQVKGNDKQLTFAESLLKKQPHSAELHLCLGRLCLNSNLWGKAKSHFENSISLAATPEAYEELGKLLERLNDQGGACTAYRQGLALAVHQ